MTAPHTANTGLHVDVRRLVKRFGEREVLHGLDLAVPAGQFVAIVGRSGCGKSTLLRQLAGLDALTAGSIALDGRDRAALSDDVRIMFQDARLLPWRTVIQNVAIGLPGPKAAIEFRAREVLAQVGLADRADDWPSQLSGGQRQRVALARALIHRPRLLLLDEPLGALDALTRIEMQRLIERIARQHGFTAVLVTHDVSEAVALADRILLIEDGRITLDQPVELPRPREHGEPAFAALENRVLKRLMTIEAIGTRNQQRGRVEEILIDDVLSEVLIRTPAGPIAATISTRSLSEQSIEVGADVLATFKSSEVLIARAGQEGDDLLTSSSESRIRDDNGAAAQPAPGESDGRSPKRKPSIYDPAFIFVPVLFVAIFLSGCTQNPVANQTRDSAPGAVAAAAAGNEPPRESGAGPLRESRNNPPAGDNLQKNAPAAARRAGAEAAEASGAPNESSVYFDYDRFQIRNEFQRAIADHGRFANRGPDASVLIQGNADERGSREYNLALGQRRAEAVRKALILRGVPEDRIEAVSLGEEKPRATGHDEASWAENRRADILHR